MFALGISLIVLGLVIMFLATREIDNEEHWR